MKLDAKRRKAFIKALGKADEGLEEDDVLRETFPGMEPARAIWAFVADDPASVAEGPVEAVAFARDPTFEELHAFLSRYPEDWATEEGHQRITGWPVSVHGTVVDAFARDPERWRAAHADLPPVARRGLWLVRALAGDALPAAAREEVLDALADCRLYRSNNAVDASLKAIGATRRELGERMLAIGEDLEGRNIFWLGPVLGVVPFAEFVKLVEASDDGWSYAEDFGRAIVLDRADPIDDLLPLVRLAEGKQHADRIRAAVGTAVLQHLPAGATPPPVEQWFGYEALQLWERLFPKDVPPGLARLPRERLHALVRRGLAEPNCRGLLPALRFAFDPALFGEVLAWLEAHVATSNGRLHPEVEVVGRIGAQALPFLEARLAGAPPKLRVALRRAIHAAYAADPSLPIERRHLEVDPELVDFNRIEDAIHRTFFDVLGRLPLDEARALAAGWIAADASGALKLRDDFARANPEWVGPTETPADVARRLARESGLPLDARVYALLPGGGRPGSLNALRRKHPGVDEARWPKKGRRKMEHVLTLDLAEAPELRARFDGARALAVFVTKLADNEATEYGTDESAVLALSEAEAAGAKPGAGFTVEAIDVPAAVLAETPPEALAPLARALRVLPGRALGRPDWIQAPEGDGGFVLQFGEDLVDVNLGDAGRMYVFEDTAFWQCH